MLYVVWALFELLTGGGAVWAYMTDHTLAAIVLGVLFVLGLLPILGDGIGEIFDAFT